MPVHQLLGGKHRYPWSDWKLWVAQNLPDALDPDPAGKDEDGPGDVPTDGGPAPRG